MSCKVYEWSYRKGWPDQKMWHKFVDAMHNKQVDELEDVVRHQETKVVDADIYVCKSNDLEIMNDGIKKLEYGSDSHIEQLKFLQELSTARDIPLEDIDNNSCAVGYRVPSWFLRDVVVDQYRPNWDYMVEEVSFQTIQNGKTPREPQIIEGKTPIITGRDAAAYVKTDNPMQQWMSVVDTLLSEGVQYRVEQGMVRDSAISRFASCGAVYMYATLGEALKRLLPLSFREKWDQLLPRPEEAAQELTGSLLSQTYNTGSPYHPSQNAMHYFAAAVLCEVVLSIFDRFHVLPSGKTVEEECELFRDNIGYWRCWAAVHYPTDQSLYTDRAKALAAKIIMERYG